MTTHTDREFHSKMMFITVSWRIPLTSFVSVFFFFFIPLLPNFVRLTQYFRTMYRLVVYFTTFCECLFVSFDSSTGHRIRYVCTLRFFIETKIRNLFWRYPCSSYVILNSCKEMKLDVRIHRSELEKYVRITWKNARNYRNCVKGFRDIWNVPAREIS